MDNKISELLKIKKNDIISITGSGGKTTLMEKLAEELKQKGRVLVTTTTKIRRPSEESVDFIFDSFEEYKKMNNSNAIVAIGNLNSQSNKFSSLKEEELIKIMDDFDYIIIEADGCRNLPLKMWKSYEPVIYNISSKVVSVFSAKTIDRKIQEDFIYNYDEFKELIDENIVDHHVYLKLIKNNPGPFGDFFGEKYVFFNQVDDLEEKSRVKEIIHFLKKYTENINYISGSLLKEEYYEY